MDSPFSDNKFIFSFALFFLIWGVLHAFVVQSFGFSWITSVKDASVELVFFILGSLLIGNTLRFYLPKDSRIIFIAGLVAISFLLWIGITGFLLLFLLEDVNGYREFYFSSIIVRSAISILIFIAISLVFAFWFALQNQNLVDKHKSEAETLMRDAELNSLQEKLQPHFLFNSLNSINALVVQKPQEARKMVQQLSDFLRSTLKRRTNEWVTLDEEMNQLQLYFEIEKVRFGHRLEVEIDISEEAGNKRLPPFILLPILENAIKFGLYDTLHQIIIKLSAHYKSGAIEIVVSNPFDPGFVNGKKGTGFGLKSVSRRLYLLFQRTDLLQTYTEDDVYYSKINIPQHYDKSDSD